MVSSVNITDNDRDLISKLIEKAAAIFGLNADRYLEERVQPFLKVTLSIHSSNHPFSCIYSRLV